MSSGAIYLHGLLDALSGNLSLANDSFAVMLLGSDYVPDRKNHRRRSDVADFEISGEGYREGGQRVSVSVDVSDDEAIDVLLNGTRWTQSSLTARYAVYYRIAGGRPEEEELIAFVEFDRDIVSSGSTFSLSESRLVIYQPMPQSN